MKITKRRLKRIIREEKKKVLREESSAAVEQVISTIEPNMEEMSKAELELLSMKLDDLIAQLEGSVNESARTALRRAKKLVRRRLNEQLDVAGEDIIDGYYNAITELIFDDMAAAGVDPHENPEEIEYAIRALKNIIMDLQAGNF